MKKKCKKDEEISKLKNLFEKISDERDKLEKSIQMVRFSAIAREEDNSYSFDNLKNIYKINTKY